MPRREGSLMRGNRRREFLQKREARTGTATEAPRTEVNLGVTTCPRDCRSHAELSLAASSAN